VSDVVLKVENLYKRYRLGTVDRQAFKEDIASWWAKLRGKPDPYEQYITSNELANIKDSESMKNLKARYVWALQDINFEVKQGEIVGIIGKNGAGKSTLLKILSKTTTPTKGQVKIRGRIASLLEVGTGFHGELTGRENIYLNGAILGMTRHEINRHLDEIIDFAGVEAYIDTPVKRYSSGMYVRLAFAVGAHLLSDILIVDEVLAVGDAEFQKKCIGKMKDVSTGEGKTVLFVSHNMTTITKLCNSGIVLKNGVINFYGNIKDAVNSYLQLNIESDTQTVAYFEKNLSKPVQFLEVRLTDSHKQTINRNLNINDKFSLFLHLSVNEPIKDLHLTFGINSIEGENLLFSDRTDVAGSYIDVEKGEYFFELTIPCPLLNVGKYYLWVSVGDKYNGSMDYIENALRFEIEDMSSFRALKRPGYIYQPIEWRLINSVYEPV
jgi:lipopolysaccharide transport system ATP-binding protein